MPCSCSQVGGRWRGVDSPRRLQLPRTLLLASQLLILGLRLPMFLPLLTSESTDPFLSLFLTKGWAQ